MSGAPARERGTTRERKPQLLRAPLTPPRAQAYVHRNITGAHIASKVAPPGIGTEGMNGSEAAPPPRPDPLFEVVKKPQCCLRRGGTNGCGKKDVVLVVPDLGGHILGGHWAGQWELNPRGERFPQIPGEERPYPGEYMEGLKHWGDGEFPEPDNVTDWARLTEEYKQGQAATCSKRWAFCLTCLHGMDHRVYAQPLDKKDVLRHEKHETHMFSWLYRKLIKRDDYTPAQRAKLEQLYHALRKKGGGYKSHRGKSVERSLRARGLDMGARSPSCGR
jgi:hypothetical protein